MAAPEEINADMLAFWNGKGGRTWVARQEHTDITLTPVTDALLGFAAPRAGERVVDIGCGCGAPTLEFARAVGPSGRVVGFDISGPMLAEGKRRASAAVASAASSPSMSDFCNKIGTKPTSGDVSDLVVIGGIADIARRAT